MLARIWGRSVDFHAFVPQATLIIYASRTGARLDIIQADGGQARQLESVAWPERVIEIAEAIRRPKSSLEERVSIANATKWFPAAWRRQRRLTKKEVLAECVEARNRDAIRLLKYLNRMPSHRWSKVVEKLPELRELARRERDETARQALNVPLRVEQNPMPLYHPVANSPRILAAGATVLQLPRGIRKTLMARLGWHTLDLAHAQLSIVAKIWDVAPLQEYLEEGKSFWTETLEHLGLDLGDKDFIKTCLYSLIFGAGVKRMTADWKDKFGEVRGADLYRRWVGHPVVTALHEARIGVMRQLDEQGYGVDAYGHRWEIERWTAVGVDGGSYIATNVRLVMACQAQSYELMLLAPVLDVVDEESRHIQIVHWLHDGTWMSCPAGRERVLEKMIERVNVRAR